MKNKERLDQVIKMLQMAPFHLLSWCATRMCHFLDVCIIFGDSLVPLYNTLVPCNVNTEPRDKKTLKKKHLLLKATEPFLRYLRQVDKSAAGRISKLCFILSDF